MSSGCARAYVIPCIAACRYHLYLVPVLSRPLLGCFTATGVPARLSARACFPAPCILPASVPGRTRRHDPPSAWWHRVASRSVCQVHKMQCCDFVLRGVCLPRSSWSLRNFRDFLLPVVGMASFVTGDPLHTCVGRPCVSNHSRATGSGVS